ncbi:MAG TPA: preprotein translocase subunit YajC [Thermoanaerobaculia bacterium]|nr:preprotein translocase subunit YajC [Thermoanaerobaculia bacterium]
MSTLSPVLYNLAQAQSAGQNPLLGLLPMVLIFAIFYVVLFMPMRKRQKALAQVIEGLKKGDRVVTNGGIYGEVVAVDGPTLILKVADNVKMKFAKSAVAGLETEADKGGKA